MNRNKKINWGNYWNIFIIYHDIFFTSDICEAIHVTGDTSEGGLYLLSDKRASDAPNNPVWKNSAGNRFIFNDGGSAGWRIGAGEETLTTGGYVCKGKHILMIFTIASMYIFWIHTMSINHI